VPPSRRFGDSCCRSSRTGIGWWHNAPRAGIRCAWRSKFLQLRDGRIAERAEASLPAPWEAFAEGRDHFGGDNFIRTGGLADAAPDMYVMLAYWNDEPPKPAGAAVLDFIASARQDVPRLVAEVRRLKRSERLAMAPPRRDSERGQNRWEGSDHGGSISTQRSGDTKASRSRPRRGCSR
jgi:hypothetical protein